MSMSAFFRVDDLQVYQRLCQLHMDVCEMSRFWPHHQRFELAGQARRSSNSAPAQLAEKHNDRHARNNIEGVNRARGESLETVHHLFVASLKGYITSEIYESMRMRYHECVCMLNGLEKTLERQLPPNRRKWPDDSSSPNL